MPKPAPEMVEWESGASARPVDGAADSNEFFYLNRNGEKDDERLHGPILREHDWPIDEAIMGPIRKKHRAAYFTDRGWDENKHPRVPKGSEGGGQFGTSGTARGSASRASAARLYRAAAKTADEIVASVPGAKEASASAVARLATVVPTDALPSRGGFKQANGTYVPSRAVVHEKIVQKYINPDTVAKYTPEPGQAPTLTILGGRGGSGKSWLTSNEGPIDTSKSLVIDNDEVKAELPEYAGWNAAQLHEEASDIVAMIDARAAQIGMNVVLDGTLKSQNIQKRIDIYQAPPSHEYALEGFYMYASPETAATRALKRFKTDKEDFSGRFVPPEVILGNTNNEKNFDAMSEGFRRWAVYESETGPKPKLVQEGGKRVRR